MALTLRSLLEGFASSGAPQHRPNPETLGLELEYRHPLALGGPGDEANKILVPPEKHVELVRFWARTFQAVKRNPR